MPRHDTKQAEKDYLRRSGASDWDLHKPFSPPGTSTIEDSRHLFQDFAAALMHLPPRPTDRVLDLAAGVCWFSDWLQRLNIDIVSVDISHDMLVTGRRRLPRGSASHLVAGDLESLPFASGSFDRAYCLSAIHHVPDIGKAVREIARVLADDGAVLFSEPGVGHSTKPVSISAMQDFGVLEQDIVAADFMHACAAAGFQDVQLKPMSYVIPEFGLTADQWTAWQRLAQSKRPARAVSKIWRALLELAGLRKSSGLFEEAFAMSLVRLLRGAMSDHPVIVASKGRSLAPRTYLSKVTFVDVPARVAPGKPTSIRVRAWNVGNSTWPARAKSGDLVRLGVQLLDHERRLIERDFHREDFDAPIPPGGSAEKAFLIETPCDPGSYFLKVDVVVEGVAWLEARGGEVGIAQLHVAGVSDRTKVREG